MRVLLVSANREQLPSPVVPIGLLYVAAAIRDTHDVKLVDVCFDEDPFRTIREAVGDYRPDVVGLGLRNLHDNAYGSSEPLLLYYEEVARTIRETMPAGCKLVLGGAAITLRPQAMRTRLGADHVVVGEGERAFSDLLNMLAQGEEPPAIIEAAAIKPVLQPSALVRTQSPRSALDDLKTPARDLVDPRHFELNGTDNIQTKRGCAFQCSYCDYPDLEGRKVRMRSPHLVAEEMTMRAGIAGVSYVFIVDSVFNVPRSHALAVCDELIARGSPTPWVCYVSPASLDEELIERMARAGCIGVEIGTDSGTPRVLERLNKPFTIDQVRRVHAAFRRFGIYDCHTFVVGAEDETAEEVSGTLRFVDELDPDVAVFVAFMEDRESYGVAKAKHREAILELLAREAPKRPGWVVPEIGVRFGAKLTNVVRREKLRGPSWIHLAKMRREMRERERVRSVEAEAAAQV